MPNAKSRYWMDVRRVETDLGVDPLGLGTLQVGESGIASSSPLVIEALP